MRYHLKLAMALTLLALTLSPAMSFAAKAKKYQVTGVVLELTKDVITVEKGEEKWEISRTADTKVTGDLKVGAKVTIEYTMTAADVEVKSKEPKTAPAK